MQGRIQYRFFFISFFLTSFYPRETLNQILYAILYSLPCYQIKNNIIMFFMKNKIHIHDNGVISLCPVWKA